MTYPLIAHSFDNIGDSASCIAFTGSAHRISFGGFTEKAIWAKRNREEITGAAKENARRSLTPYQGTDGIGDGMATPSLPGNGRTTNLSCQDFKSDFGP